MLINRMLQNKVSRNRWCLCLVGMFSSKMPYFREMGAKLNITVKFVIWEDSEIERWTGNLGW